MEFMLHIRADNAAFTDQRGVEIARILRDLAKKIDGGNLAPASEGTLRDINGNRVGFWNLIEDGGVK